MKPPLAGCTAVSQAAHIANALPNSLCGRCCSGRIEAKVCLSHALSLTMPNPLVQAIECPAVMSASHLYDIEVQLTRVV